MSKPVFSDVNPPPAGPTSSLSWSKGTFFVATSWDGKARCWEVGMVDALRFSTVPKCEIAFPCPLLCSVWDINTNAAVFLGDADNAVSRWDLASQSKQQIGAHSAPVKSVLFWEAQNIVISGSWDKTVKFWDTRSPNPVHTINTNFSIHAMDYRQKMLLAASPDKKYMAFDLSNTSSSPLYFQEKFLQYQLRTVSVFPDGNGFGVGSIEGRASINVASEFTAPVTGTNKMSFAFKCHRLGTASSERAYPVNDISWHPNGTFFTAGGDGNLFFWDKDAKQQLGSIEVPNRYNSSSMPNPIVAAKYSYDGGAIAIATSYDWFKGEDFASQYQYNDIFITKTPAIAVPHKKK